MVFLSRSSVIEWNLMPHLQLQYKDFKGVQYVALQTPISLYDRWMVVGSNSSTLSFSCVFAFAAIASIGMVWWMVVSQTKQRRRAREMLRRS